MFEYLEIIQECDSFYVYIKKEHHPKNKKNARKYKKSLLKFMDFIDAYIFTFVVDNMIKHKYQKIYDNVIIDEKNIRDLIKKESIERFQRIVVDGFSMDEFYHVDLMDEIPIYIFCKFFHNLYENITLNRKDIFIGDDDMEIFFNYTPDFKIFFDPILDDYIISEMTDDNTDEFFAKMAFIRLFKIFRKNVNKYQSEFFIGEEIKQVGNVVNWLIPNKPFESENVTDSLPILTLRAMVYENSLLEKRKIIS